jgi:hypothetical protein
MPSIELLAFQLALRVCLFLLYFAMVLMIGRGQADRNASDSHRAYRKLRVFASPWERRDRQGRFRYHVPNVRFQFLAACRVSLTPLVLCRVKGSKTARAELPLTITPII